MFALLVLAAIAVGVTATEIAATRQARARIAAGIVPLPPHEKPYAAAYGYTTSARLTGNR